MTFKAEPLEVLPFIPKLILFDCDGVLIDSEIVAAHFQSAAASELGINITPEEIEKRFVGVPNRITWETITKEANIKLDEDFYKKAQADMQEFFNKNLVAIDGVKDLLQNLKIPFCVASSTKYDGLVQNLKTTDLYKYFDGRIFSSSMVEKPKPAPDVFLYACNHMGFAPDECLVIEDSPTGARAAKSANIRALGFLGASNANDLQKTKLLQEDVLFTYRSHQQLLKILDNSIG